MSNQPTFASPFADDLAAVVDQAVDAIDARALQTDLADVDFRRILRTEDRGLDAGVAGIGRERRAGIAVGRHRHVLDAERFGHRYRHDQPARLERAGRQPAFVLHQQFAAADFGGELRQRHDRRHRFAEADDVLLAPHREKLAIAPQIRRTLRQRVLAQRLLHAGKIVTHQQGLADAGQVMDFVGGIVLAGFRAFEMRDESFSFGRQIVVGVQGSVSRLEAPT